MNNNQPNTKVVTDRVRLSYAHLFTPHAGPNGGEPRYSVTILIPKSDLATKQRIDAAIQTGVQEGVASRWGGVRPPQIGVPIYDGDGIRPSDGMPFGDECKGHWVMTASSKQPPQIVDANLNPIINQTEVYSGIYGRVSVRFFPYLNSGKKGIGCGLNNVQKLADGEPLGGRSNAADDFGGQPAGAYAPQPPHFGVMHGQPQYAPPQYAPQQPQIDPITGKPTNAV